MAYGMKMAQKMRGGKKPMSPPKRKDPYRMEALRKRMKPQKAGY